MVNISSSSWVFLFMIGGSFLVKSIDSFAIVPSKQPSKPMSTSLNVVFEGRPQEECPEIPTTPQVSSNYETCILASGWFWHPQRQFKYTDGVARVVVGYTGGEEPNPTYQNIQDATEAYLIEFDPTILTFEQILNDVRILIPDSNT